VFFFYSFGCCSDHFITPDVRPAPRLGSDGDGANAVLVAALQSPDLAVWDAYLAYRFPELVASVRGAQVRIYLYVCIYRERYTEREIHRDIKRERERERGIDRYIDIDIDRYR